MKKPKLTIEQQVDYMENDCGIKFNICSKEEAINFLNKSSYFFKVKAFAKNYNKVNDKESSRYGKYQNLDFAYLKELSTLDMYLRKEILSLALDVEHFLKVWMIKDLSDRSDADGYEVVEEFFEINQDIKNQILSKSRNSYCKDLCDSLNEKGYALWNVIELLSFGDFTRLYEYYSFKYDVKSKIHSLLGRVRHIRNAAAHNNCILNSLKLPYSQTVNVTKGLDQMIMKTKVVSKKSIDKKLSNPVAHDFAALLFAYDRIVESKKSKQYTYQRLKYLFDNRMLRNKSFFDENTIIVSYYNFFKKIIDFLYEKSYNE